MPHDGSFAASTLPGDNRKRLNTATPQIRSGCSYPLPSAVQAGPNFVAHEMLASDGKSSLLLLHKIGFVSQFLPGRDAEVVDKKKSTNPRSRGSIVAPVPPENAF